MFFTFYSSGMLAQRFAGLQAAVALNNQPKDPIRKDYQRFVQDGNTIFNESAYTVSTDRLPIVGAGTPCTAHRWFDGDGWRQNTGDNSTSNIWEPIVVPSPNLQPKGVIRCASSAETEPALEAFKGTYVAADNPIAAVLPKTDCFSMDTHPESFGHTLSAPTEGEDIIWLNFDIRPLSGTYQFQIVTNQSVGFVLFYVDPNSAQPVAATSGTMYPASTTGLSGDCNNLVFSTISVGGVAHPACGLSGNGWSTITVPSFNKPTNYYLAMWMANANETTFPHDMNLLFKARHGCGGATCTLEHVATDLHCNNNGTYTACVDYGGSAGRWIITAPGANSFSYTTYRQDMTVVSTGTSPMTLGTIPDGAVFAKVCAIYPMGVNYDINLTPDPTFKPNDDFVPCSDGDRQTGAPPTVPDLQVLTVPASCGPAQHVNLSQYVGGPYPGLQLSYWDNAGLTVPLPGFADLAVNSTHIFYVKLTNPATGCYDSELLTVTINPVPTAGAEHTAIACNGGNSTLTVSGSGGTPPYTYSIDGNTYQASAVFTVPAGTYTVWVKDSKGCTDSDTEEITQPPLLTPDITKAPASTTTLCGVTVAAAQAAVNTAFNAWLAVAPVTTGGTPPYTVVMTPTTPTAPLYTGGITSVTWTVTDACGRTDAVTTAFTVNNACLIACATTPTPLACPGVSTGSILVRAAGGFPPYNFYLYLSSNLNNQLTSVLNVNTNPGEATFSNLAAGTYTILITDAATNLSEAIVCANTVVTQPPELSCSINPSVNPTCYGGTNGSLTVVGSGGTAPYMYSLNGGVFQANGTFTGLSANVLYTVTTKDAHNCTSTCTKTLTQPDVLTCSINPCVNPTCNGGNNGSLTVVGSGGTAPYMYSLNGGAFQTSGTFTGLSANVLYTVTVKDAHNCTSTCTRTLTQASPVSCSINPSVNPACYGGANGSLTVVGSGGTAPYMYSLNGGVFQASGTFTGLSANVLYTVTVKDANNCTSTCTKTLTQPTALTCSINPCVNPTCSGGNNGSLTVVGSGGTAPYTYSLNGGVFQSSGTFTGLSANVLYTVTVKDAHNCTSTCTRTLTQGSVVSCSIYPSVNPTCYGGTNGSLTVVGSGGTAPYMYSLNGGAFQTSGAFTGLSANVLYTLTVKDANNCTSTCTKTLTQPAALTCSINPCVNPTCSGGNNGSLTVVGSGGTAPYMYSLNGGVFQSSGTFTGLSANVLYTLTVKDAHNCTSTCTRTLIQGNAISCSIYPSVNPSCYGGTNGSLTAVGSNGTAPYMYSLNGGVFQASGTFTGLSANVLYTVTVKDANNCTSTCTKTLTQPSVLSCSINPCVNPTCNGGNNGSLTVVGSGGTAPYTYSLNGGAFQTSGTFTGLSANVLYTLTVKDANNCTSTCTRTLTQGNAISCNIYPSVNPTCYGGNNGSLTAVGSGGTAPYMYSLNGGTFQTSGTFTGLSANVLYTVNVKDANNCTSTCTITLTQPPLATPDITKAPASTATPCGVSAATAQAAVNTEFTAWLAVAPTVTGGTPPYNVVMTTVNPTAPSYTGGNISVTWTVTDACGRTDAVTASFTVTNACIIACATTPTPVPCSGAQTGSILARGSGGVPPYNFYLYLSSDTQFANQLASVLNINTNPGEATFSNLAAGTYTILITDATTNLSNATVCANTTVTRSAGVQITENCSNDSFIGCGQSQEALNADYASWYNSLHPTGGTNLTYQIVVRDAQNNIIVGGANFHPNKCGAVYTATVTYSDDCAQSGDCQGVYTVVGDTEDPVLQCPEDQVIAGSGGTTSGNCIDLGGGGIATVDPDHGSGSHGPDQHVKVDFRQPRNQDHPDEPLDWTNGINNQTQAEYFEGMGVPQRIIFTQLEGTTHTLKFRHEAVKHQSDNRHAYDFLMSWDQAIATAAAIGNGAVNELQNLIDQTCNEGISADAAAACANFTSVAYAPVTDSMGNPPNHHGNRNVNDVISCFETQYGNRNIEIRGNAPITSFNIVFDGYSGSATGDNYAWYTITWTSASDAVMIKLAGRAAQGDGSCGYGACYGAGSISGGPYHFKLETLDDSSLGNRDNQLMVEKNDCTVDVPVTFGTPSVSDNCDMGPAVEVLNSDVVTVNPDGSKTHCRTWKATDDCGNSSTCSQCITVTCEGTTDSVANKTDQSLFTVYPVPFKEYVNVRYDFDYHSKARIEIYDAKGVFVQAYDDADAYLNKEVKVDIKFNQGDGQLFIIKLITDKEVGTKRIISGK